MKKLANKKVGHLNYKLFILLLVVFLLPCCKSKNIDMNDVEYVKFFYLPKHTLTPSSIDSCKKIYHYHSLRDTIIYDRNVLDSLKLIINSLREIKVENHRFDFRLIGMVVLDNGDTTGFCSGEYSGIKYNGKHMEDSPIFFEFINKVLYNVNAKMP